jgi:hypothetical protein
MKRPIIVTHPDSGEKMKLPPEMRTPDELESILSGRYGWATVPVTPAKFQVDDLLCHNGPAWKNDGDGIPYQNTKHAIRIKNTPEHCRMTGTGEPAYLYTYDGTWWMRPQKEIETKFRKLDMVDDINYLMTNNPDFEATWLEDKFGKLYLKRKVWSAENRPIAIINISFHEHLQKQGRFTQLLTLLEEWAEKLGTNVLVEQAQERYLGPFLEKRGYQRKHPESRIWINKVVHKKNQCVK